MMEDSPPARKPIASWPSLHAEIQRRRESTATSHERSTGVDIGQASYFAHDREEKEKRPPPGRQAAQASLDGIFERAQCIRIVTDLMSAHEGDDRGEPRILFETDEEEEMLDAYEAMAIAKGTPRHCTCPEDPRMEIIGKDGEILATLSLHHGRAIRWDAWSSDACLADGRMLLEWLRRHGVEYPLEGHPQADQECPWTTSRNERSTEPRNNDERRIGTGSDSPTVHCFPPTNAKVIHDPYRWLGVALLLPFVLLCAKVGFLAIPIGLCLLALMRPRVSGARSIGALNGWGVDVRAMVGAGADGLTVNGKVRARSSQLTAGFVVPDRLRGPSVLLERKRGWPLMLRVRTKREARNLLRALGLDASQKAVTRRALCGPLTIGIDGIAGSGADGREIFFHCSEVKDVSTYHMAAFRWGSGAVPDQWGVDLALHDGRSVRIPVTQTRDDPLLTLIEERIRECVELARNSHVPDNDEVVARRGRTGLQWLRGLRATVNAGYRAAAVDTVSLSRLVLDARARPSARAAAAIVLASSGETEATTKLRIAAESIANPHVRIALTSVATASDDGAVAEALEALDEIESEGGRPE